MDAWVQFQACEWRAQSDKWPSEGKFVYLYLKEIFYASAHTGVIFDYENNQQRLLQGHVIIIDNNNLV
jgi:hypothetical protein